jgi:hypothetical protein
MMLLEYGDSQSCSTAGSGSLEVGNLTDEQTMLVGRGADREAVQRQLIGYLLHMGP